MGSLFYGDASFPIDIEDRALAHVKVVVVAKLRRREAFTLSWRHGLHEPRGRSTLWVHWSIPLRFVFDDPQPPKLDPAWVQLLAASASTSGGIHLVPENDDGQLTIPGGEGSHLLEPGAARAEGTRSETMSQ